MSSNLILSSLQIFISILQFTLAGITILSNPKGRDTRIITLLLFVFGLTSVSVGFELTSATTSQVIPWLVIQTISVYLIGPFTLLASLFVLRPSLSRRFYITWPIYAFIALPIIAVFLDVINVSDLLFGQHLALSFENISKIYAGGYISVNDYVDGLLKGVFYWQLIVFFAIGIIFPTLYAAIRDRKSDPVNSRFAVILLISGLFASISNIFFLDILPPTIPSLIANIAYALGFVYIGFQKTETRINISGFANIIQNFPMFNKLLVATIGVLLPSILVIGFTTFNFFQENLLQMVGSNVNALSKAESTLIQKELENQIVGLSGLYSKSIIYSLLVDRASSYSELSEEDIASQLEELDTSWMNRTPSLIREVFDPELNQEFLDFLRENPQYTVIFLVDNQGGLVTATTNPDFYNYSLFNWWDQIRETEKAFIYSSDIGEITNRINISIAIPIYAKSADRSFLGAIYGTYKLDKINSLLEAQRGKTEAEFAIFKEETKWIAASDPTELEQEAERLDLLQPEQSQEWKVISLTNEDYIISWSDLQSDLFYTETPWDMVAYSPYEQAISPILGARTGTTILIVIILTASIFSIRAFARMITQPLITLTEAAEKILEGEQNVQADISGTDEIGTLASTFNRMSAELFSLVSGLEETVEFRTQDLERRAAQLQTSALVAREAAEIRHPNELLERIVNLIPEQFGYYHAGVFLVDERGEYAVLQAANSEGGQRMLARGHKLQVGKVGVVGFSAGMAEPRIAQDVGADVVYYDNPDMPNTRSEMALPLIVRGKVIGVLDVQSTEANAFQREDVEVLQILADQIALAIDNSRLLLSSQSALEELEVLYGEQVSQAWKQRLTGQEISYQYNPVGIPRSSAAELWEEKDSDGHRLTQEISFRGQIIGQIDLLRETDYENWTEDEKILVEEILEQTALALENARLVDQIRLRSDQIQLLQEITAMAATLQDEHDLLAQISQKLYEGLGLLHCGIVQFDDSQNYGTLVTTRSDLEETPPLQTINPIDDDPIIQELITNQKTLVVTNVQNDPLAEKFRRTFAAKGTSTSILLPLVARGNAVGMVTLDVEDPDREVDEEDLNLFNQISGQISTAIDSSRLFTAEQQGRRAAATLLEITQVASSSLDLEYVLRQVTYLSAAAVFANRCTILLLDEERGLIPLISQFADGREVDRIVWGSLRKETAVAFADFPVEDLTRALREPQIINDPKHYQILPLDWINVFGIKKLMFVPLVSQDRIIGTLLFDLVVDDVSFTRANLELAQTIAGQIATTIENANLFRQTVRRAERERLVAEITGKIRSSNDPKIILQTAISELQQALGRPTENVVEAPEDNSNNQDQIDTNGHNEPSGNQEGLKHEL